MIHHHDTAFPPNGALNRKTDASYHAGHPKRHPGVEPQPRPND
jgi:hypothetical protein